MTNKIEMKPLYMEASENARQKMTYGGKLFKKRENLKDLTKWVKYTGLSSKNRFFNLDYEKRNQRKIFVLRKDNNFFLNN